MEIFTHPSAKIIDGLICDWLIDWVTMTQRGALKDHSENMSERTHVLREGFKIPRHGNPFR